MKTHIKTVMLLAACVALAPLVFGQMEAPKPGAEHKKLEVFLGSWTLDGDVKPNPMGPGGKMTENEKCEWMDGNFFMVCHVDFKSAHSGTGSGLSIMGYSTDDKNYTYRDYNSWGETMESKGSVDGDTWTWTNDEKMGGGTTVKAKFTIKMTSATAYTFTYETSPDGTKWTTLVDGNATKNK